MASTYVNDLRLNEMATGDESGNWGVVTNSNLELIGEALGYGTEGITTNADTHTTTVADGATDPGRAMYIEYTGTLDSACTITIAPNTLNRVHLIENGTSGSQNIIISQGSGANITIPPGDTKAVYLDGAGSGAAVVDAFASLSVVDLKVQDDLTVTDDVIIGGDIDLEGSIDVNGTANLDVVDIDGAVDMASTLQVDGAATFSGDVTLASATANKPVLTLTDTNADSQGPDLVFRKDSADPADGDELFRIYGYGDDDGGTATEGFLMLATMTDVTNGTEDSKVQMFTYGAGSQRDTLTLAGLNVGIGVATPTDPQGFGTALHIEGAANSVMYLRDAGNDNYGYLGFEGGSTNRTTLTSLGTGFLTFGTDNTERMRIDSSGDVGIGTTETRAKLTSYIGNVTGQGVLANSALHIANGTGTNAFGQITFGPAAQTNASSYIGELITDTGGNTHGEILFGTRNVTTDTAPTERMRITSSGQLFIGTTASQGVLNLAVQQEGLDSTAGYSTTRNSNDSGGPSFQFMKTRGTAVNADTVVADDDNLGLISFAGADGTDRNNSGAFIIADVDGTPGGNDMPGRLEFHTTADGAASPTLRATILANGELLLGITGNTVGTTQLAGNNTSSKPFVRTQNNSTGATNYFAIFHANSESAIGSINVTNSATQFNTSSDYRLKENVKPIENGLERLNNLNPVKFDWKEDGTSSEGFIAHEAQEVFPDAVTGKKDAEMMQGMDYGRITPLLVKAIQEQQTIIEDLKTRITTLEGE